MAKIKTLITDVDNTLYDWFDIWYASFSAMLDKVVDISKLPRETLLTDIQEVFRRHHTSEYSFVLEECKCLQDKYGNSIRAEFDLAIQAYRAARGKALQLYPGVLQTLQELQKRSIQVIAYTESLQYYTVSRLKSLGLESYIDQLYSPPDSESEHIEKLNGKLETTIKIKTVPKGELKPNTKILNSILEENHLTPADCIYIGDSEMKDINMANDIGMLSVLAAYGATHFAKREKDYGLLQRVSHWSDEDIAREKELKRTKAHAKPDYTAESFSELLKIIDAQK